MQTPAKVFLFDSQESHENLLPLSFTRPVADIRIGIDTIRSKWQRLVPLTVRTLPVDYLRDKFGQAPAPDEEALFVPGSVVPDPDFAAKVLALPSGHALMHPDGTLLAFRGPMAHLDGEHASASILTDPPLAIRHAFDIFIHNPACIEADFQAFTDRRTSAAPPSFTAVVGPRENPDGTARLFIDPSAQVAAASINLTDGPVYIGEGVQVMEGAMLRGPLALCSHSTVRMGAKIYGGSTFGPWCKVGGEIDNTVMFGFSNKAHDGYLGNAVIGEWCNIGAGVNASNLKNDYSKIRIWNYRTHTFMRTDLQFCGPVMGDHTKIGVNCMLNTATVLGVGVNIHGCGFPRVFVPSFSEGSPAAGFSSVPVSKFIGIAERAISRRNLTVTESDIRIFQKVYEVASRFKG